ncbi:MAG: 50S ribosomal protein L25 [Patescibacteria group bacterium]
MISLKAKIRDNKGKKSNKTREAGGIPAVVYGPGVKNISLEIDQIEFKKVFKEAGESSLIDLKLDKENRPVLIHEIQRDPVSDKITHVDFFQASLKEEVEVTVPLVFEGVAPAIKELGATLVKNMTEIQVKALPQNLPHEIKVNIDELKAIGDHILVKNLPLAEGVKVLKKPDEIVVSISAAEKVEEELAKEIEEKVENVEKVEKEKKEEVVIEENKNE